VNDDTSLLPFDLGQLVRRQWHDGRWFLSVVDVVAALTDTDTPRRYWSDLKRKLHQEGFQLYEKIVQLKMRSLDGKSYATDAADVETMLRVMQSIPSPKAEPVKQWLAKLGSERLHETPPSDLLAGLTEDQRRLFLRGQVADRNITLAETAQTAGIVTTRDFALFQDWGYRGCTAARRPATSPPGKRWRRVSRFLIGWGQKSLAAISFANCRPKRSSAATMCRPNRKPTVPTTRRGKWCAGPSRSSEAQCPKTCPHQPRVSSRF